MDPVRHGLCLDTQSHDGVDDVIIVLLQSFDGLFAADTSLGHDQLNVLVLETGSVDFLVVLFLFVRRIVIIIIVLLLSLRGLGGLAGLAVVVAGVVVVSASSGELLSGSLLGSGVDVLDLGLTKDTARC